MIQSVASLTLSSLVAHATSYPQPYGVEYIPYTELRMYLLAGTLPRQGCLTLASRPPRLTGWTLALPDFVRHLHAVSRPAYAGPVAIPLRKQWKDEAKQANKQGSNKYKSRCQAIDGWELTVGVEIHAQLNTCYKLFSSATTSFNERVNSHVAFFDVAMPGSQPLFQREVLPPAIRSALALNCKVQPVSRFDRKHYFWWDQPAGYQITQYYDPLARDGFIRLNARDGIALEDGDGVTVRIQQIQLEQDTAKTLAQPGNVQWLDFNRVGVPLIEIITEPDLHHPRTAAVLVRKIQLLLSTVDACVSGMETGGLRVDVNVSVKRTDDGSKKFGTRTEIKNLSTIKAVEDAIIAERDRQIRELEAGGHVSSETRGWAVGSTETRRLRCKEGEVDYRYMPDPDIAPLVIGDDLVEHLRKSLAVLPDVELDRLVADLGLSPTDAFALVTLDGGARVEYFYRVLDQTVEKKRVQSATGASPDLKTISPFVANWVIHELGRVTTCRLGSRGPGVLEFTPDGDCIQIPLAELSQLLYHLYCKQITGKVAKELLMAMYLKRLEGGVLQAIEAHNLWFQEISEAEYKALADEALQSEERMLSKHFRDGTFPRGKLMYLVGKMMRLGRTEWIDPAAAERVLRALVENKQTAG